MVKANNVHPLPSSRDRILDVAESLFARHGYAGVGMREVARVTELSKSSLFHHFPTKLALYGAVYRRILERMNARLTADTLHDRPAPEQLERWVSDVVESLAEKPSHAPILLRSLFENEELEPDDRTETDRELTTLLTMGGACIARGIQAGEFRKVSVNQTLQSVIGMIVYHFASGEFGDELLGGDLFSEKQIQKRKAHVWDFLSRALAPE